MPEEEQPFRLSENAFRELKEITKSVLGESMTDQEIEEIGIRILRLFSVLALNRNEPKAMKLSDREADVLRFLYNEIRNLNRSPSVRAIAQAFGLRSSRSGCRILARMIDRGLVRRDEKGNLQITDAASACEPSRGNP